jgi:hypothetical protein
MGPEATDFTFLSNNCVVGECGPVLAVSLSALQRWRFSVNIGGRYRDVKMTRER